MWKSCGGGGGARRVLVAHGLVASPRSTSQTSVSIDWMFVRSLRPPFMSTGPGEPPEDDAMNQMILLFRYRTRNSSPHGLRSSTLLLVRGGSPQNWIFTSERGRNIFLLKYDYQSGEWAHKPQLQRQAALTPGPPINRHWAHAGVLYTMCPLCIDQPPPP